ncbi:MAG: RidA family protein [Candidatus Binatia bacterium]
MSEAETKLEAMGYPLDRVPTAGAMYRLIVIDGTTAYLSGVVPFDGQLNLAPEFRGKVPSQVSVETAKRAAALCAANHLRILRAELGSLDRVERILRVNGYVNSDLDFSDQPSVINGYSQLMADVLGENGWHARSAVGMAQLPLQAVVEVDMIAKLR